MPQQVMATRDFGYNRAQVRRGQVFTLAGCRNDGGLLRHGHVKAFEGGHTYQCAVCGRVYATEGFRQRCGAMDGMSEAERLAEQRPTMVERRPAVQLAQGWQR